MKQMWWVTLLILAQMAHSIDGSNSSRHRQHRHREWSIGNGSEVHHKSSGERHHGLLVGQQRRRQDDPPSDEDNRQFAIIEEQSGKPLRVKLVNGTNPEGRYSNFLGWWKNILENRTNNDFLPETFQVSETRIQTPSVDSHKQAKKYFGDIRTIAQVNKNKNSGSESLLTASSPQNTTSTPTSNLKIRCVSDACGVVSSASARPSSDSKSFLSTPLSKTPLSKTLSKTEDLKSQMPGQPQKQKSSKSSKVDNQTRKLTIRSGSTELSEEEIEAMKKKETKFIARVRQLKDQMQEANLRIPPKFRIYPPDNIRLSHYDENVNKQNDKAYKVAITILNKIPIEEGGYERPPFLVPTRTWKKDEPLTKELGEKISKELMEPSIREQMNEREKEWRKKKIAADEQAYQEIIKGRPVSDYKMTRPSDSDAEDEGSEYGDSGEGSALDNEGHNLYDRDFVRQHQAANLSQRNQQEQSREEEDGLNNQKKSVGQVDLHQDDDEEISNRENSDSDREDSDSDEDDSDREDSDSDEDDSDREGSNSDSNDTDSEENTDSSEDRDSDNDVEDSDSDKEDNDSEDSDSDEDTDSGDEDTDSGDENDDFDEYEDQLVRKAGVGVYSEDPIAEEDTEELANAEDRKAVSDSEFKNSAIVDGSYIWRNSTDKDGRRARQDGSWSICRDKNHSREDKGYKESDEEEEIDSDKEESDGDKKNNDSYNEDSDSDKKDNDSYNENSDSDKEDNDSYNEDSDSDIEDNDSYNEYSDSDSEYNDNDNEESNGGNVNSDSDHENTVIANERSVNQDNNIDSDNGDDDDANDSSKRAESNDPYSTSCNDQSLDKEGSMRGDVTASAGDAEAWAEAHKDGSYRGIEGRWHNAAQSDVRWVEKQQRKDEVMARQADNFGIEDYGNDQYNGGNNEDSDSDEDNDSNDNDYFEYNKTHKDNDNDEDNNNNEDNDIEEDDDNYEYDDNDEDIDNAEDHDINIDNDNAADENSYRNDDSDEDNENDDDNDNAEDTDNNRDIDNAEDDSNDDKNIAKIKISNEATYNHKIRNGDDVNKEGDEAVHFAKDKGSAKTEIKFGLRKWEEGSGRQIKENNRNGGGVDVEKESGGGGDSDAEDSDETDNEEEDDQAEEDSNAQEDSEAEDREAEEDSKEDDFDETQEDSDAEECGEKTEKDSEAEGLAADAIGSENDESEVDSDAENDGDFVHDAETEYDNDSEAGQADHSEPNNTQPAETQTISKWSPQLGHRSKGVTSGASRIKILGFW